MILFPSQQHRHERLVRESRHECILMRTLVGSSSDQQESLAYPSCDCFCVHNRSLSPPLLLVPLSLHLCSPDLLSGLPDTRLIQHTRRQAHRPSPATPPQQTPCIRPPLQPLQQQQQQQQRRRTCVPPSLLCPRPSPETQTQTQTHAHSSSSRTCIRCQRQASPTTTAKEGQGVKRLPQQRPSH